jgi:hypothetical protein
MGPFVDNSLKRLLQWAARSQAVKCVERYFKTPAGMPWLLLFIAWQSFPRKLAISLFPQELLSSFMKRRVRLFTPYRLPCDPDCGMAPDLRLLITLRPWR